MSTPIVFIPGQFSDETHAGGLAAFAEALTLPGYGGASAAAPAAGTLPATLDFLDGALVGGRSILIGNSAGAQWATAFAAAFPSRVERVVLLNPGGFWSLPGPVIDLTMQAFTPEGICGWSDEKLREDFGALFVNGNARDAYLAWILERRFDPAAASRYIRASFETALKDSLAVLASARIPVDVVIGARDTLIDLEAIRTAAGADPNIRLREIPEAGHMPQLDCPSETAALVEDLLGLSAVRPRVEVGADVGDPLSSRHHSA